MICREHNLIRYKMKLAEDGGSLIGKEYRTALISEAVTGKIKVPQLP